MISLYMYINKLSTWCTDYYLKKTLRHKPVRRPTNKPPSPPQSVLTQAVYRQATWNSHREWQYHMLHVYNRILLKMSNWGSKYVEENSILWINNNQCIKLVINNKKSIHDARSEKLQYMISHFVIKCLCEVLNWHFSSSSPWPLISLSRCRYMQTSVSVRTCYCAHATLLSITCKLQFRCAHATAHMPLCYPLHASICFGAHMLLRTCHSVIHYMQASVLGAHMVLRTCHPVINYMQAVVLVRSCYFAHATVIHYMQAFILVRTWHSVIHYIQAFVLLRTCYCAHATLLSITYKHLFCCAHATAHMPLCYPLHTSIYFGTHMPLCYPLHTSICFVAHMLLCYPLHASISLGAHVLLRTCHCALATLFSSGTFEMSDSAHRNYCMVQWQCLPLKTDNQTFPHFLQYFKHNSFWFVTPILILSLLNLCIIVPVNICIFFSRIPAFSSSPSCTLYLPTSFSFLIAFALVK